MSEDMNNDINKYFIGKVIRVDRGGPESRIGMLLDASEDHLCLLTEEDGVFYYNTSHIKSFTDNIKSRWHSTLKFQKISSLKKLLISKTFLTH
ncbi:hypothetical protein V7157_06840 [Neobacillus drentensis]|uniref:hypothetical protein n=1 Tax=Neobacillus drentensis TaxID=220684 RepID=UPI002FFF060A